MSFESHFAQLQKKHQILEREIESELTHPSSDTLHLTELKRRKLQLKDEMNRLRNGDDTRDETLH